MTTPHPNHRRNISEDLADTLRDWIFAGRLESGARINEVHLARELGVSRTPLREALTTLVAEGALASIPRRGFFVCALTKEEAESIYPIRALLDPEALKLSGIPSEKRIAQLERLNAKISKAKKAEVRISLDDEWHLLLVADCPNKVLLDLILQFIRKTRRYESAYLSDATHVETAVDEHDKILKSLRAGRLNAACEALRQNLSTGLAPILEWLEHRAPS